MKITVEDQMAASPLRNPVLWFTALTFFLLCLGFLGFRFSSFLLTSSVLILSMMYFAGARKPLLSDEKFVAGKPLVSDQTVSTVLSAPTRDLLSESECADDNFTTTEDSDVEWPAKNPDCSDGSISDEESLIEIALPTGHYVRHKLCEEEDEEDDDETRFHLQKLSDFQKHKHLMELLAEFNDINEEENLIEIDISMGSIKYSRFEIEA